MDRIIKFRAWSPKWKKMIYDGVDGYTISVHSGTIWLDSCDDECATLMQYTGINDENGVDVYEGDRIMEDGEAGYVIFQSGAFVICWDMEDVLVDPIGWDKQNRERKFTVIGNMYEKPVKSKK